MTKELRDKIVEVLNKAGVDEQSKGYAYLVDAIALLVEEEQSNMANNGHK